MSGLPSGVTQEIDPKPLTADLLARVRDIGLDAAGVIDDPLSRHADFLSGWISGKRHGQMRYLAREDALDRRVDLRRTLESFRSALVVAQGYFQPDPPGVPDDPGRAVIARYARGEDYHTVLARRLDELHGWLEGRAGRTIEARAYVDTGPILERELGRRVGLGWFGKNTMLIHPERGSYFFLGVLLLDLELTRTPAFEEDHCGTCRACLDACPTGALLGYDDDGAPVMDARRCISYLTIELKGPIPRRLRPRMGNRVFGCDICQEVCPWNEKFATASDEAAYSPRAELDGPTLIELAERLLGMSGKGFAREFAGSPVVRTRRNGLLRNACVALGNWGVGEVVPVLATALCDPAPLVRGHAAWGLGRVGSAAGCDALSSRLEAESDPFVLEEIGLALGG
jgi:epoxyqueuosine reductase